MLPKSSKHFIQPTAEVLGYDYQLVADVTGFFYSELRKALVNMKGPIIKVDNLGSFKAKTRELPKLIHKYEKHLAVLQPETFNQMAIKKDLEIRLEKVRTLQRKIEAEQNRRKEFYEKKYKNT